MHNPSEEQAFDRALGIDTSLIDFDWVHRDCHPCQPTPIMVLEAVAQRLSPSAHIVDYGCGTGRAVFYLKHIVGCTVTGVEMDERRYAQALDNLRRYAQKHPDAARRIHLIHQPAQTYSLPGESPPDAFYCFNPFPARILRGVLERIDESPSTRPRRMFCYYPDTPWRDTLEECGWRLIETVHFHASLGNDYRERLEIYEK